MEILYFFSKYSYQCREFDKWLLYSSLQYKSICIDNKSVRKIISSDIQIVPCLFILDNDGTLLKYQGTQAFEWIQNIINQQSIQDDEPTPSLPQSPPIIDLEHTITDEPIEHTITDEPIHSIDSMKRTIDSSPLIQPPSHEKEQDIIQSNDDNTSSKPESLMSLAQKLQKEREE